MNLNDLPVVSSTDYKAASPVELDIKNGGNFVGGVVSMAKHSLHPLELCECGQLDGVAQIGSQLARPLVDLGQQVCLLEFLALVCFTIGGRQTLVEEISDWNPLTSTEFSDCSFAALWNLSMHRAFANRPRHARGRPGSQSWGVPRPFWGLQRTTHFYCRTTKAGSAGSFGPKATQNETFSGDLPQLKFVWIILMAVSALRYLKLNNSIVARPTLGQSQHNWCRAAF